MTKHIEDMAVMKSYLLNAIVLPEFYSDESVLLLKAEVKKLQEDEVPGRVLHTLLVAYEDYLREACLL